MAASIGKMVITELEKKYWISYGTSNTWGEFVVHTPNGEVRFKRSNLGLPYINLKDSKARGTPSDKSMRHTKQDEPCPWWADPWKPNLHK